MAVSMPALASKSGRGAVEHDGRLGERRAAVVDAGAAKAKSLFDTVGWVGAGRLDAHALYPMICYQMRPVPAPCTADAFFAQQLFALRRRTPAFTLAYTHLQ